MLTNAHVVGIVVDIAVLDMLDQRPCQTSAAAAAAAVAAAVAAVESSFVAGASGHFVCARWPP